VRYKAARYPRFIKNKDKLVLTFEIPLSEPLAFKGKNLRLYIYDETYFVDMSWLNKQDMQISDQLSAQCKGEIVEPKASDEQRAYTLSLASDVAPDNTLGQLFSQKYQLNCKP
jgi:tRNA threonylcarbamoyladenosine biosynthesis protein TsaE